jgi:hypothetical protein
LSEAGRHNLNIEECHASSVEHIPYLYRLYRQWERKGKGVFNGGKVVCQSIPKEDEWRRYCGNLYVNEVAYQQMLKDYNSYWSWMANRNDSRWIDQESNADLDFDCFLDSETEFLTKNGWKKYDNVSESDLLATVDKNNVLEWQGYYDRFDKKYTGKIYTYQNSYIKFSVTPNHKLLVSDCHRGKNKNSLTYHDDQSNWYQESVEEYFLGKRSHKHMLVSCRPKDVEDYAVSDDYIRLLGGYLSDGSINFDRNKDPQYVCISQLERGRLCEFIDVVKDYEISVCSHKRHDRNELTYIVKDTDLAREFLKIAGHGASNKRVPEFVSSFSSRQFELFLDSIIAGDGHNHPKGHRIYYTISKELADGLYALLVQFGYVSKIMGPYDRSRDGWASMYQVFLSSKNSMAQCINKNSPKGNRKSGWSISDVDDSRIVCFSVRNSTLITRNGNKMAILGNCKNMQHTIRLLYSGINILKEGEPIVRFSGDKLKFLRDIREDKYNYEYLMSYAEELEKEAKELYRTCKLPEDVDFDAVDNFYRELTQTGD